MHEIKQLAVIPNKKHLVNIGHLWFLSNQCVPSSSILFVMIKIPTFLPV